MKKCRACGEDKPSSEFLPSNRRRLCRKCTKKYWDAHWARVKLEVAGELSEKACWRCKQTLPIEEFSWKPNRARGRIAQCNSCRDPNGPRRCARCGEIKPKEDFYGKLGGLGSYCKPCNTEYGREQNWRRQYGLTPEEYENLAQAQGNCCAICGTWVEVLWVDHDHSCCPGKETCGKCRRGLVCMACNGGLGMFLDDIEVMKKAIAYLEFYREAVADAHGVLFRVA